MCTMNRDPNLTKKPADVQGVRKGCKHRQEVKKRGIEDKRKRNIYRGLSTNRVCIWIIHAYIVYLCSCTW